MSRISIPRLTRSSNNAKLFSQSGSLRSATNNAGAPKKEKAGNAAALRRAASTVSSKLLATVNTSVEEQLGNILVKNHARVIDFLQDLDADGSGMVERGEWMSGMRALGLNIPDAEISAIFDAIDEDGSGIIDFKELRRALTAKSQRQEKTSAESDRDHDRESVSNHLRSMLGGGLLISGDEQALRMELEREAAASTSRSQLNGMHANDELLSTRASVQIQAHARGYRVRSLPEERAWTFATTHVCELSPGEECLFNVRANERIDLVSAVGDGRVLLDATDASGHSLLPCKSAVWDSGLQKLASMMQGSGQRSPVRVSAPETGAKPIFSGPGAENGQTYIFSVDGDGARIKLKFSLQTLMLERNLVEDGSSSTSPQARSFRPSPRARSLSPNPMLQATQLQRHARVPLLSSSPISSRHTPSPPLLSEAQMPLSPRELARSAEAERQRQAQQEAEARYDAALTQMLPRTRRQLQGSGGFAASPHARSIAASPDLNTVMWPPPPERILPSPPASPTPRARGRATSLPAVVQPTVGASARSIPRVAAAPGV